MILGLSQGTTSNEWRPDSTEPGRFTRADSNWPAAALSVLSRLRFLSSHPDGPESSSPIRYDHVSKRSELRLLLECQDMFRAY